MTPTELPSCRFYGEAPYRIVVIHGGPGAPGEMAPVARELSPIGGVIEPLQSSSTIDGQVDELRSILEEQGDPPIDLIGYSWGAWLAVMVAARYPDTVRRLILIGSGSFEESYTAGMRETRLGRLSAPQRREAQQLLDALDNLAESFAPERLARLGELLRGADSYDPVTSEASDLSFQPDVYRRVGPQAAGLRRSGRLMQLVGQIRCPVVAIHGDYDPHPAEGVEAPLSGVVKDFRFHLLKNCGHMPWIERQARDRFYKILKDELSVDPV